MSNAIRSLTLSFLILFLYVVNAQAFDNWTDISEMKVQPVGPSCMAFRAKPVHDSNERKIKILVTNDVHGRIFENEGQKQIGYALLQGRINAARNEGFEVFLFDAGDSVSGNAITQFDSGISVAETMGRMGYRVVAPGNHEFDFNTAQGSPLYYSNVLLGQMREHAQDEIDAVCLNLTYKGSGVPGITREPVVLIDEPGFRLAVIGVLTPYTRQMHNESAVEDYDFGLIGTSNNPDHEATKQNILEMLTNAISDFDRPGDIIVVLSHVGSDDTEDYSAGQLTGKDLAGVPNVDFVVDSHSHNVIPAEKIGDAFYGLAGRYLTNVNEMTIVSQGGELFRHMEVRGYDELKEYPRAENVLEMLRDVSDRLGLDERLFELKAPALEDVDVDRKSVAVARLICKGMLDGTGSDLAFINSGNIRSSMVPGWITAGDLYDVIPFQNNTLTFLMNGTEIQQMFDKMKPRRTNAFPQFYGMKVFTWEEGATALKVAGILDKNNQPLQPEKMYCVALNNFIAYGGDGYELSLKNPDKDFGDMATGLILYLRNRGDDAVEEIRDNESLLIYPTREEAEQAYSNAQAESKAIAQ